VEQGQYAGIKMVGYNIKAGELVAEFATQITK
jgi:hypothetical protein